MVLWLVPGYAWHKRMRPRRFVISDSSTSTLTRVCREYAAGARKPSHQTATETVSRLYRLNFPALELHCAKFGSTLQLPPVKLGAKAERTGNVTSFSALLWPAIGQDSLLF